jgi:hypothetical protein
MEKATKSNTTRQKLFKQRMLAKGMRRLSIWCHEDDYSKITNHIKKLNEKRGIN